MNRMSLERRRTKRFRCSGEATIYCMATMASAIGRIADLSLHGCRLYSDRTFSELQKLEVTFSINRLFVRVQGYVRNAQPDGALGIEFDFMSERTTAQLKEIIGELKEQFAQSQRSVDREARRSRA